MRYLRWLLLFLLLAAPAWAVQLRQGPPYGEISRWLQSRQLVLAGYNGVTNADLIAFFRGKSAWYGEAAGNPAFTSAGQRRVTTERAAEVMGYRSVAEFLSEIPFAGNARLGDIAKENEAARRCLNRLLPMVRPVTFAYSPETDIGVAVLHGELAGDDGMLAEVYQTVAGSPKLKRMVEGDLPYRPSAPIGGSSYDGVIVDVSAFHVQPALFNRLFTSAGETVYTPLSLSPERYAQTGGVLATSQGQARSLLAKRGVRNPLIVKGLAGSRGADVRIGDADAAAVVAADRAFHIFAEGRVAFVFDGR
ncbi:hypothetical protein GMSM_26420 [Geomonas sp. Red276]